MAYKLSKNYYYLAETIANNTSILDLINALAVFIKQKQTKVRDVKSTLKKAYKKKTQIR